MTEKNISRRSFLKRIGAATAAITSTALVGCGSKTKDTSDQEPPKGQMTYRINPNTNDKVSILGYGMMRLPTKGQKLGERQIGDEEVDLDMVNKQVDYALEHGLNYFDTSPVYTQGMSEKHTGIALKRHKRDSYFIATKMSNMHTYDFQFSVEMFNNSLKELQTDYIDYYLLHAIGGSDDSHDPIELFEARFITNGLLDWLKKRKEEGKIRNLGFSFHGDVKVFDHALEMHDKGEAHWDFVQIELNYLDWLYANEINAFNVDAEYLYKELEKRNIPAVIMEPLLGGRLANMPQHIQDELRKKDPEKSIASWAFRYAGTPKGVLTVLSGMTYMEHLRENLKTYCPLEPLSDDDMRFLDKTIADLMMQGGTIPCNDCKYCMPCPYGVDIPGIFVHYNKCVNNYQIVKGTQDANYAANRRAFLVGYDRSVPKLRQADHCIGCGKCMPSCPQRIKIPVELHRISEYVESLKQNKFEEKSES